MVYSSTRTSAQQRSPHKLFRCIRCAMAKANHSRAASQTLTVWHRRRMAWPYSARAVRPLSRLYGIDGDTAHTIFGHWIRAIGAWLHSGAISYPVMLKTRPARQQPNDYQRVSYSCVHSRATTCEHVRSSRELRNCILQTQQTLAQSSNTP